MIRLTEIAHDNHYVRLIDPAEIDKRENVFTVVVGKNGVGKSRLLGDIAQKTTRNEYRAQGTHWEHAPVVIAASTSPFDKFPSPPRRRNASEKNYRYVGMRGEGLYGASSAVSLLSSASRGLLSKLANAMPSADLLTVFRSLQFTPHFEFFLKPLFRRVADEADTARLNRQLTYTKIGTGRDQYLVDAKIRPLLEALPREEVKSIVADMISISSEVGDARSLMLQTDFERNRAYISHRRLSSEELAVILRLFDMGLLRLADIQVEKKGYGPLSLRRASSGEQCLLVLMLGIAGHIQDGSLILIDEPEISLHPEWQESFMEMLQISFAHYAGCQFIVATHSPQIIARLQGRGAFVYSLSKQTLFRADQFSHRSADYQLAELFDAPGMMNEYISRVCFNLIAQLRPGASPTRDLGEDIQGLLALRNKLRGDDRLRELIDSVQELYASHAHD